MPSKTIDIHPHIIANDEKRYPLAPLGGHQSDWSHLRPVGVDQMIAAMDEAGVIRTSSPTTRSATRWRRSAAINPIGRTCDPSASTR